MKDDIIEIVENRIKYILKENFYNSNKSILKRYYNRINFACPFCGDSAIDENKKRGNFYLDSLEYHCYNCGVHLNIYQFLKRLNIKIDISELNFDIKKKKINNIDSITHISNDYLFSREEIKDYYKFQEIEKNDIIYKYLKSRYIPDSKLVYFLKSPKKELIILNIDISTNNIISFYIRNIFHKRYITYTYDRINNNIKKTNDNEIINLYRKVSTIFNIFNIDFSRKIYVLEGQFDSLFIQNSIAISGISNINKLSKLEKLYQLYYILDNDESGRKCAIKLLNENKKVFLWDKYLKDNKITTNIKDINDLVVYSIKNNKKLSNISNYFSNNKIDIIHL